MNLPVALDCMSGDHGCSVAVAAAAIALRQDSELSLILVGQPEALEAALRKLKLRAHHRLEIVPASEVVGMDEEPAKVLRAKKDSSMRVAINLVHEGRARAAVSAGNTGALMATARFVLKTLPTIDRPAIMAALPARTGLTQILDLGANAECTPEQLLQFAWMGSAGCRALTGREQPTVALLNIGQESIKGNSTVKAAAALLENSPLNYVGFVEGNDIFSGRVDVVVCDGFSGNIALKASEGLAKLLGQFLRDAFMGSAYGRLAGLAAWPVLRPLRQRLDPGNYNGASFVGLRGVVVKSHGAAEPPALANAIRIAAVESQEQLPQRIEADLARVMAGAGLTD